MRRRSFEPSNPIPNRSNASRSWKLAAGQTSSTVGRDGFSRGSIALTPIAWRCFME
jgi:hypothetical protein